MAPLVEHPYHQEKRACAEAVTDHQQNCTADPLLIQREYAQHDETHVRDRRVGDQ